MKKCKYHCDYGDGEYCHYKEIDGCINNKTKEIIDGQIKDRRMTDAEESLCQRLYNSIGFLNAMCLLVGKRNDKTIEIDEDNLLILRKLLMDCKKEIVR